MAKEDVVHDLYKSDVFSLGYSILYAVSLNNFGIQYVQGMNFIVGFLYEIFGEEDAFYMFLLLYLFWDNHLDNF